LISAAKTKATLIGHDGLQSPQFGDSLSMQECTLHCSIFFIKVVLH